jgi:hypothetical protein
MYYFIQSTKQKLELFHTAYQTVNVYHPIMITISFRIDFIQPTKHYLIESIAPHEWRRIKSSVQELASAESVSQRRLVSIENQHHHKLKLVMTRSLIYIRKQRLAHASLDKLVLQRDGWRQPVLVTTTPSYVSPSTCAFLNGATGTGNDNLPLGRRHVFESSLIIRPVSDFVKWKANAWLKKRKKDWDRPFCPIPKMEAADAAKSKRRPNAVLYGYQLLLFVAVASQSLTKIR